MPLLLYSTFKIGQDHMPKFYSMVQVCEKCFMGHTKATKKNAEQDVAEYAFTYVIGTVNYS